MYNVMNIYGYTLWLYYNSTVGHQGKEVAVAIHRLPEGTVIFEDVAVERRRGRITKTLKAPHSRRQSDPLAGKITYETLKGYVSFIDNFSSKTNSE